MGKALKQNLSSFLIATIICVVIISVARAEPAPLNMDFERDALSLHGTWQSLLNHETRDIFLTKVADRLTEWKDVEIPKNPIPGDTWQVKTRPHCVWLRRSFNVTDSQAARDAVLKFNGIRFGASSGLTKNSSIPTQTSARTPFCSQSAL